MKLEDYFKYFLRARNVQDPVRTPSPISVEEDHVTLPLPSPPKLLALETLLSKSIEEWNHLKAEAERHLPWSDREGEPSSHVADLSNANLTSLSLSGADFAKI